MSRSEGSFSPSQRELLDDVQHPVRTEDKKKMTVWGRSVAVDRAKRLLISRAFSRLHAFLGNSSLYNLDRDQLLEWNEVERPQFTARNLSLVLASLSQKVI